MPASPRTDAWRERLGLAAWIVAAILWWVWFAAGDYVVGPQHLVAIAGLVLALAFLARRGWLKLFGPVLFYEILRNARRGRLFLLRMFYAVGLLLLLFWVHSMWSLDFRYRGGAPQLDYKAQADLAQMFFIAYAIAQFLIVVALTPAYVAGSIAEEKERKTLEFLLATDLRNREIVFGKFVARLGNLTLFLLTGLPVLSLLQVFGGIDPGLLLVSFAATALTALSLAAVGIANSVSRRKARDAIVLTYFIAIAYVALASASELIPPMVANYRSMTSQPSPYFWEGPVNWLVEAANYGNPFIGLAQVVRTIEMGNATGTTLADVLSQTIKDYTLFHGLVALVCVAWAVWRLRRVALTQVADVPRRRMRRVLAPRRPRLRERPVFWKEVWVEGGLHFGWLGRIFIGLLVLGSFAPIIIMAYYLFFDYQNRLNFNANAWQNFGQGVNAWLRTVNVMVSTLMLLGVTVRAAGSIGGERDRDTLTSLMGTPLTTGEIILGKWWGSVLSVRLFLIWLGAAWLIAIFTGSVNPFAVILQALAWAAPAACFAAIGLYCSAVCKTTLRATTWALLAALFALGGHWLVTGMCCFLPLSFGSRGASDLTFPVSLEGALSPPAVFAWTPFREWNDISRLFGEGFPGFAVMGMVLWCAAAAVIGGMAHERFRRLTHRNAWGPALAPVIVEPRGPKTPPPTPGSEDSTRGFTPAPYRAEEPGSEPRPG